MMVAARSADVSAVTSVDVITSSSAAAVSSSGSTLGGNTTLADDILPMT